MKLISMTEFVLKQYKKWENDNNPDCQSSARYILGTKIYADFLKQPLKLEMFVACDKDGNFLEEKLVENYENDFGLYSDFKRYNKEYNQAKEKVLFEGFKLVSETEQTWIFKIKGEFPRLISKDGKIEWLQSYNNITLTPNAIKQLGL